MPLVDGLDSGPPLPPGMTAQRPPATVSQMAGPQGGQQGQPLQQGGDGDPNSIGMVYGLLPGLTPVEKFMVIEKCLGLLQTDLPTFAPAANKMVDMLRAQGSSALQSAAQPSGAPSSPMQSMLGSIGGAPQQ